MRTARRFCPAVDGDICSICCGTERENTLRCPFECAYLREARLHERAAEPFDSTAIPNKDIVVRDRFIDEHGDEITQIGSILVRSALSESGVDNDVRESLEALIRTWRTRQSGLYYDTRPENVVAARICDSFQKGMEEYLKDRRRESLSFLPDSDVMTILAFLQRIELDRNNGRRLGRAFIDFLRERLTEPVEASASASRLIHLA